MQEKIVTPKFLTREMAAFAVERVIGAVMDHSKKPHQPKRQLCHVVILVPSMMDDRESNYQDWPNYSIEPHMLYEHNVGSPEVWTAKYDEIAKCKALQLWHERNDDRTDVTPHLLFPGDTPFWGGVRRHGIVVACSGVESYFDKMISGMVADMLVGLAYHAWMTSEDKKKGVAFLS